MSYDIAVIDGDPPSDHKAGLAQYLSLMNLLETDSPPAPTERVLAFAKALALRWPAETDDEFEDSPWAGWPLEDDVVGSILYTGVRFSAADEVIPQIAVMAAEHGLVCFDPQSERVLAPQLAQRKGLWARLRER